jgi:hypothetical protein
VDRFTSLALRTGLLTNLHQTVTPHAEFFSNGVLIHTGARSFTAFEYVMKGRCIGQAEQRLRMIIGMNRSRITTNNRQRGITRLRVRLPRSAALTTLISQA